jgi:hypothetical protein
VNGPVAIGETVVIHGTESLRRAISDWPTLLSGQYAGDLYQRASSLVRPGVRRVIGHSLGAAYALRLAQMHGLEYAGYGRPGLHSVPGDLANLFDPVSLFIRKTSSRGGHSIVDYAQSGLERAGSSR